MMMLEIRGPQVDAVTIANRTRLVAGLVQYLQDDAPDLIDGLDLNWVSEAVGATVDRADALGIVTLSGIYSFVTASFMLGPTFFEESRISKILPNAQGPEGKDILEILSELDENIMKAALEKYDGQRWLPEPK
jgi:hypothetical protein